MSEIITLEFCRKRIAEQLEYIEKLQKTNYRIEVMASAKWILGYFQQKQKDLSKVK